MLLLETAWVFPACEKERSEVIDINQPEASEAYFYIDSGGYRKAGDRWFTYHVRQHYHANGSTDPHDELILQEK